MAATQQKGGAGAGHGVKRALMLSGIGRSPTALLVSLSKAGWEVEESYSPEKAFRKYSEKEFDLLFIEYPLKGVNLHELYLKVQPAETVLLLHRPDFSIAQTATVNRLGGFVTVDDPEQAVTVIDRVYNQSRAYVEKENITRQREKVLEQRFQTESITRSLLQKSKVNESIEMVKRIRHNFSQSSGIEAVINLIELIKETSFADENGVFQIQKEMLDPLFHAAYLSRQTVEAFNNFLTMVARDDKKEQGRVTDFFYLLDEAVQEMQQVSAIRDQKLVIAENVTSDRQIEFNFDRKAVSVVIKELILNGLKFSEAEDSIIIIPFVGAGKFGFDVINPAYEHRKGVIGVSEKFQDMVFEPFFRMQEYSDASYIEYEVTSGLGLGLTLARHLVKKHGGEIEILNLEDHRLDQRSSRSKVLVELKFLF